MVQRLNSFYFDISGQTYQKTIIGSIGVTEQYSGHIFSKLREGGRLLITNRKLRSTKKDKAFLLKIMRVLDKHKIYMNAIVITRSYWNDLRASYQNFGNWEERAYAYFYFEGFRHRVREKSGFSVTLCRDTFFDIENAQKWLYKLSKSNKLHPNISISHSKYSDYLKIADVVARSVRLLPYREISKINNLKIIENPRDNRILNKLFPIKRRKK